MPHGIERWSFANAVAALLAATISVAQSQLWPSLAVASASIAYCWALYAPRRDARANVANLVTGGRLAALVLVMATCPQHGALVGLTAGLVFAFDGVDGWLARWLGEASGFGAHLDMETDAHVVLLVTVYSIVAGGFGPWVIALGAMRYVYVIARAFTTEPARQRQERRSRAGRWVFALVSLGLAAACVPQWAAAARPLLMVALLALGASFAPDFLALVRRPTHSTIA